MIEFGKRYETLKKAHENEEYRKDIDWILEIESLTDSHLVKAVEMPALANYADMLVADGESLNIVLRLPVGKKLEQEIARLLLEGTKCKAALYMLNGEKNEPAATWLFDDFSIGKMKLQSFDRDRPAGTIELLLTCSFKQVKIV